MFKRNINFHVKSINDDNDIKSIFDDKTTINILFSTSWKYVSHLMISVNDLQFFMRRLYIIILSWFLNFAWAAWINVINSFSWSRVIRLRMRYVRYWMFLRVITMRNKSTSVNFNHIFFMNRFSSLKDNVAVNIMNIWILFNSFNFCNLSRKFCWSFNITWHSSMTIRFNRFCSRNLFMNRVKSSFLTNSDVIITILTSFDEFRRFHSRQSMFKSWHFRRKSCRNAIKKTTICIEKLTHIS